VLFPLLVVDCRINPSTNIARGRDMTPLSLTDMQLTTLMTIADQLYQIDRDPFLRAVADRFAGKSEVGEGEFSRGLRTIVSTGTYHWALNPAHTSKRYAD
jgi:hypothetical protein